MNIDEKIKVGDIFVGSHRQNYLILFDKNNHSYNISNDTVLLVVKVDKTKDEVFAEISFFIQNKIYKKIVTKHNLNSFLGLLKKINV